MRMMSEEVLTGKENVEDRKRNLVVESEKVVVRAEYPIRIAWWRRPFPKEMRRRRVI